jgi:hypothetical protein
VVYPRLAMNLLTEGVSIPSLAFTGMGDSY